jgi:hypothetical protein
VTDRRRFEARFMEERLRELAESGERAGLPGEGRPFARGDLEGNDARWAAFRLMKNNKVIPAWSQARIELDGKIARLRTRAAAHPTWLRSRESQLRTLAADRIVEAARVTSREDARVRAELGAAVRSLNALIDRYNAIVPAVSLQLPRLRAAGLLASGS